MNDTIGENFSAGTLSLLNEPDLLARIAKGDEKAFGLVFHHYRGKIYSYAFHLTESRPQADELVQDVFLKVWLYREKVTQVLQFDSWLFTIARNQVFDRLKQMAKEATFRKQMADLPESIINPVEDQLLSRENEDRLQKALDQLSPRQKLIFNLSRKQGMKHEEIASRLQISRNTVKTHLVQALKTLREALYLHSDGMIPVAILLLIS